MKKLLCLALLLVVVGCEGCTKTIHIIHDRHNPDNSMGIVVIPFPMPEPPVPMPDDIKIPKPLKSDPWCMLPGLERC